MSSGMFERFDENLENVENYIYRLKQFMLISKTKEDFKTPFLISCIGPKYFGILRNLVFPEEVDQVPFDKLCKILLKHFNPKTNIIYERFVFHKMDQKSGEAISKYIIRLKEQAQRCNFGDFLQESLRDRFVAGIIDTPTQKKLLQEEGLTFEGALDIALSAESADNDLHNLKRSEDAHRSPQHLHAINNPCKHCGKQNLETPGAVSRVSSAFGYCRHPTKLAVQRPRTFGAVFHVVHYQSVVAVNFLEHSVRFSGTFLPVEGEQQNFPQMGTFWLGNHHFQRAPEIFHDLNFSKTPRMLMPHVKLDAIYSLSTQTSGLRSVTKPQHQLWQTEKRPPGNHGFELMAFNDPILDSEITNADIYKEIAGLRSNKACGPDGIPNEVLKTLPDSYILLLKQLYNSAMTTGKYPAIWTNSTIHPIFKNGYKNSPSNYRDLPSVNLPEFGDIHLLLYADDIAIIGESRMNLQKKIKILKEYLDENLMTLNESKSKIMVFRNGVFLTLPYSTSERHDLEDNAMAIIASAKTRIYKYFLALELRGIQEDPLLVWRRTLSR
ncbi:hypothetical protein LAZ67_14000455 [Cordylochernes scorpioides]|uniref:Reverse transcriptase domain-containing protein n=1 Tax=Cordylochernes scorpioides TaxID=51811 RepID=A0ABY6L983_9ARAC|nr:hypothetical protein LAZ67_14000455 [Cordylochernes scorpioides]